MRNVWVIIARESSPPLGCLDVEPVTRAIGKYYDYQNTAHIWISGNDAVLGIGDCCVGLEDR